MIKKCRRPKHRKAKRIRYSLRQRDGDACWICLKTLSAGQMTIDHVVPLFEGGTNDIKNLRIACRWCNESRHWHPNTILKMVALPPIKRKQIFG